MVGCICSMETWEKIIKPGVFNKEDAEEGLWIESGPHLMLMPKDPSSLKGMTTDFNSGGPYIMFEGTGSIML